MGSIFGKLFPGKARKLRHFNLLFDLANEAVTGQDFNRAVDLYDQAIAKNPRSAEAHYKRGNALRNLHRLDAAIASYNEALALKPDYAYAYCNRGTVLHRRGLNADALKSYDQGIAVDPSDAMAHYNRALLMQDLSRWKDAVASYDEAIGINPSFADAHYNRSLALLFQGNFENGWREYEWRWQVANRLAISSPRNFSKPSWRGEPLKPGARLLLWSEAGLGDTLQFCRYAAPSAARGITVILEVQPPLVHWLSQLEGATQVIARGDSLPAFDYECPLMSLPLAFGTTTDTIPAAQGYLRNSESYVAGWRERLGRKSRLRVGLVWSGNPDHTNDTRRSICLQDWAPHLPPEFQYFCLQREIRAADRATLASSPAIVLFESDRLEFVDTAALCECMDVVVSVDTSVAHLSAALGQRTWILLPFTPDWRWMRDREDSPWYSTVKLYRQTIADDWSDVFKRVATDLRREL